MNVYTITTSAEGGALMLDHASINGDQKFLIPVTGGVGERPPDIQTVQPNDEAIGLSALAILIGVFIAGVGCWLAGRGR